MRNSDTCSAAQRLTPPRRTCRLTMLPIRKLRPVSSVAPTVADMGAWRSGAQPLSRWSCRAGLRNHFEVNQLQVHADGAVRVEPSAQPHRVVLGRLERARLGLDAFEWTSNDAAGPAGLSRAA